jgi:ATP-dependent helicase/nuclease subunit B
MLARAIEAIDAGNAPQTHVVLHSPSRLTAAEVVFLRALHDRDRLSAVLTGLPDDTTGWLHATSGKVPAEAIQPAYEDMHLTVAPDAEEEVRLVVRAVLAHLTAEKCRPERIGIAYRYRLVTRLDVDIDASPLRPSPAGSSTGASQERQQPVPAGPRPPGRRR